MLYGQNIPWRAALRQASRAQPRVLSSRTSSTSYICPSCSFSISRYPRRSASPLTSLFTSRNFSTTLSWHKEKAPKTTPEQPEPEKEDTEEEVKTPAPEEEPDEIDQKLKTPDPIPPRADDARAASSAVDESATSGGERSTRKRKPNALVKPSVPDIYPQVLVVPLAKRPLFPGFYKLINITDKAVASTIQDLIKRGQPYVGAFLSKDDDTDKDVIHDMGEVYDVGTFCQVTAAFPQNNGALSCIMYPHRRIKMSSLLQIPQTPPEQQPDSKGPGKAESKGDVVASFEESNADASKPAPQYDVASFLQSREVTVANVENLLDEPFDKKNNPNIAAYVGEIVNTFKETARKDTLFKDQVQTFSSTQTTSNVGDDPAKLADFAAVVSNARPEQLQATLEAMNIEERLRHALIVLKQEHVNAELKQKIAGEVDSMVQKNQREYWLRMQMKAIKEELGIESDGKDKLIQEFKDKAEKKVMPEAVKKVYEDEMTKLQGLEMQSAEFTVTRNYLDWLTALPWGIRSTENFSISNAKDILNEDHYGMQDIKDRILEFIAVGKLRGTVEGKILCMVGPPGVGKTSIGKSIAKALNREYFRFSVGGLSDVAEIKGHRRTYIGALPGRPILALKKCQTENPLIMIDEIDKVGRGDHKGDPTSALLELLDPEQNNAFMDHYMDISVDLSKVLFVCTANVLDTIPRPLLDRMEVLELSGYVADEKLAIADRYLAPQAKEMSGLKDADVTIDPEALVELINKYCRESGVRNLKKQIEKIYRKTALNIVVEHDDALSEAEALTVEGKAAQEAAEKDTTDVTETSTKIEEQTTAKPRVALKVPDSVHVTVTKDKLQDYVGPPIYTADRLYETMPPGVTMGLAWTSMGGSALYIESIIENALSSSSHPGLERTGSLRSVMKESATVAYSFAKGVMAREFSKNQFFEHARIHLHCPEGAVPKDGPSAGITMATSLLSLAMDKPIPSSVAMTGELTVTGKVLRIGGLREKTVAARRAGATMIIFPRENWSDWLELPENIKEGIEGKPVDWYSDVFKSVFPDLDRDAVNHRWAKELKDKKGKRKSKEHKREEKEEESGDEEDDN